MNAAPATVVYRAALSAYLVMAGPFVGIAAIWLASWLRSGELVLTPILICVAIVAVIATWLLRFRLALRADDFAYRAPGHDREVRYADVLDYAESFERSPHRVVLRLADGTLLPINLKVLPRGVGPALLARMPHARPAS